MSWQGKRVWITGATSGIGEALAYSAAARGADLILSARRESELDRVKAACERPEAHRIVPLDLGEPERTFERASAVAQELPVDVLINNAGLGQRAASLDTDLAVDRQIMTVNYLGTVAISKAVLPHMRRAEQQPPGLIVISSIVGHISTQRRSSYAASKHALHGFFEALRAEQGEQLRLLMVCPGFVRTNFSRAALTQDGTPQNRIDKTHEDGLDPMRVAAKILNAYERERKEILVAGAGERAAYWLHRISPWLFRRVIPKASVT